MRLIRLEILNFRAFYGIQSIDFSDEKDRPVTVIHGENGAGKTNLLNAIYWCLTGDFTPRLSNPNMLLNKAARDEDINADGYVEVLFEHDSKEYRARRSVTYNLSNSRFDIFKLENGASSAIPNPQNFIQRVIPKGLSKWFFFDAEAIGELTLSGGEEFKKSLRRTLGFELVDVLAHDLSMCLDKKQKGLNQLVKSKDLDDIQRNIDNIQHVLPSQKSKLDEIQAALKTASANLERIDQKLRGLPKSRPLQERRSKLEAQQKNKVIERYQLQQEIARFNGEAIPAVLINDLAISFEGQLKVKENAGKLPAPYSDQLVKEILDDKKCVCGRPIEPNTPEELSIKGLLKFASTGSFNARVRNIQYLLMEIKGYKEKYKEQLSNLRRKLESVDSELAEIDEQLKEIKSQLAEIDEEAVLNLENQRTKALQEDRVLSGQEAVLTNQIRSNEQNLKDQRLRYENESKKIGLGDMVKKELDKIRAISSYMTKTLRAQEVRALNILQIELNRVLSSYLTKHYNAKIDPETYEVRMIDDKGRDVGKSTGEEQVLKFAFISTVLALAGRKTQEKIDFMAEPIMAPLVLDAPFSALDPEYQSTVASNLALQTSQLVLLLSSAAWGLAVSTALDPFVGRRYALISKQSGPQGQKPINKMVLNNKNIQLNEYSAERDESVITEIK
jgi:DNA sulfur modification protein DndD